MGQKSYMHQCLTLQTDTQRLHVAWLENKVPARRNMEHVPRLQCNVTNTPFSPTSALTIEIMSLSGTSIFQLWQWMAQQGNICMNCGMKINGHMHDTRDSAVECVCEFICHLTLKMPCVSAEVRTAVEADAHLKMQCINWAQRSQQQTVNKAEVSRIRGATHHWYFVMSPNRAQPRLFWDWPPAEWSQVRHRRWSHATHHGDVDPPPNWIH